MRHEDTGALTSKVVELRPDTGSGVRSLVGTMVIVSGVVIFGLLWRQSAELGQNEHIYDYHFASARRAEIIERQIALLSVTSNWRDEQADTLEEESRSHDEGLEQGALYSIKKQLALLKIKDEQYGGMSSTLVLEELIEVDQRLRSLMEVADTSGERLAEAFEDVIAAYKFRAGQLARIHRKRQSELLAIATLQRRRSDILLLGIFAGVILGGGWLTMVLISRIARSEARLRDGGRLLGVVANNVPGGVFRCKVSSSNDIEVLYQSVGLAAVLGGQSSIADQDWRAILGATHPDDRDDVLQNIRRSSHTGEDLSCDFRIDFDGTGYRWRRVLASADETEVESQFWTGLVLDISEQKEAEATLMEAKSLADDANKSKSRFLASMSHEIRTPMNAVLGFAQIMESSSTEELSSRQKECIHQIMTGGRHLLALIDDVLDLSRIESGRADIRLARVEPTSLVLECCTLAASMADEYDVSLIEPGNLADMPDVFADHTRLRQVLLNLVTNAIKYNKKGGSVILTVSLHTKTVLRFAVDDTGEGVQPDMVDELFKPFSRLGRESLNIEGTGIGLVISKMLMEQMGGSIGYETRPGTGSTFWFDIPIADHNIPVIDEVVEGHVETKTRHAGQATVLYIEDNPANVDLVRRMMTDMPDISFLSAPDGEIGLLVARQTRPDLVLLDLNLPGMDGYQVQARLQEMEETRHSRIIALTALAMDEDIQRGARAGFSDYITKPFDIMDVRSRIRSALDEQTVVGGD